MKRRLVILGSTGSIGQSALCVVRQLAAEWSVFGLAAGGRWRELAAQATEFEAAWAVAGDLAGTEALTATVSAGCRTAAGIDGMVSMVTQPEVDVVLCAIAGTAGLQPVLAAIRAGKTIALASKEILVMAGELVMAEARRHGVAVLPVDSEHSAVFQCLAGHSTEQVTRIILTASGGPFRDFTTAQLANVSYADALAHPTWNMGPKVTIDSATMINKGLEVIEAYWLFGLAADQIDVVIHPQSIVHSMVEFIDGSVVAQLSNPDMKLPIQYALTYPERRPASVDRLRFDAGLKLEFHAPDDQRFPALRLARQALTVGGTMPAVFNAANEVAVARFRDGSIRFPQIWQLVREVMQAHVPEGQLDLAAILRADAWARAAAGSSWRLADSAEN